MNTNTSRLPMCRNQIAVLENEFPLYGSVLMSLVQIYECIERTTVHYLIVHTITGIYIYHTLSLCSNFNLSSIMILKFRIFHRGKYSAFLCANHKEKLQKRILIPPPPPPPNPERYISMQTLKYYPK